MKINQKTEKCDCIIGLGSYELNIPNKVWKAYLKLIEMGYNKHVINE